MNNRKSPWYNGFKASGAYDNLPPDIWANGRDLTKSEKETLELFKQRDPETVSSINHESVEPKTPWEEQSLRQAGFKH